MSKQTSYRFNEIQNKWMEEQAKIKGCSKNDILRDLINEAMKKTTA